MKTFAPIIAIILVLVVGGIFIVLRQTTTQPAANETENQSIVETPIDQDNSSLEEVKLIIGSRNAPVSIVEYFDYKCPNCNKFHYGTHKEIESTYLNNAQANFEIRMTPIIGPDSATAARGAYCANEQNVFADYHETVIDYMYVNYYKEGNFAAEFDNILTTEVLGDITANLGINQEAFISCVDSDQFNANLDTNLNAAADDSIQGTPGFVIGEQSFVGGQPFSVFKTLLDIELRKI